MKRMLAGLAFAACSSAAFAQNGISPNTGHTSVSIDQLTVSVTPLAANTAGAWYSVLSQHAEAQAIVVLGADPLYGPDAYLTDRHAGSAPLSAALTAYKDDGTTLAATSHVALADLWGQGSTYAQMENPNHSTAFQSFAGYVSEAAISVAPYSRFTITGHMAGQLQAAHSADYRPDFQGEAMIWLVAQETMSLHSIRFGDYLGTTSADEDFTIYLDNTSGQALTMNLRASAFANAQLMPVPEPAHGAMALAGVAVLALAGLRRRSRRVSSFR